MGANAVDVDGSSFDREVLERSTEQPVMVDFWAPWCGPCRVLGPVLERLAAEMDGAFTLVKINSDENPELSDRYGVRGIPNVLLFRDGEVVDQFVGAMPESRIRAFLRPWCPTPIDRLVAEAEEQLGAGDTTAARRHLEQARTLDAASPAVDLSLARLELAEGNLDRAASLAGSIPAGAAESGAAQHLVEVVKLASRAAAIGDEAGSRVRLQQDPGDVEAHFALGGHALARGKHRAALEHYLAAAEADRHWDDEAARRAMLTVFQLIGVRDPVSDEFRDKLSRLYY